jgi:DNA-binding NarL/FixJ family response regulator
VTSERFARRGSRSARVLIVDDHEVARAGLRAVLGSEVGIVIVGEAANGREALELCEQYRPDLILMDVRMPDMNGLEVTRTIKSASPATSVVLFTMYENPDYLIDALRAGAAGYLLKGASRREIVAAVRQVLAGESLLNPDLVLQLLRRLSRSEPEGTAGANLTPRERDVLKLIALGKTNREIADTLSLTLSTVKTHVEHVIDKLGVSDRTQAAVRAIQLGLSPTPDDDEHRS